ncbi:MAG: N-acetylglucosamine-6-phosphate deacetylase [Clostridia bacterium]|nr:N-acetylglucosamine-6-phosphate deacetylase [Clostridia bacterium]
MSTFVIDNVNLVLEDGIRHGAAVRVADGRIAAIGDAGSFKEDRTADGEGLFLSPGFIDVHVHGGGGADFMDADPAACRTAIGFHMLHGTTTVVPTTLCAEDEELARVFDALIAVKRSEEAKWFPRIAGVHLEGPFINPVQAGAQPPEYFKNPSPDEWNRIVDAAKGELLIWTVAPELEDADRMCRELRGSGIVFSAGHSEATFEESVRAFDAGFTMATHVYSSMSTITRVRGERVPGLLEASLLRDDVTCEMIADGRHLPEPLLKTVVRMKGTDRIVLVTDAMRGAGMPDGEYLLGSIGRGRRVLVYDGIAHTPDGASFAGSVATADRLVRVMTKVAGVPLFEAVKMITKNPAREIGLSDRRGVIKEGYDADLVLFDGDINVRSVFIGGEKTV